MTLSVTNHNLRILFFPWIGWPYNAGHWCTKISGALTPSPIRGLKQWFSNLMMYFWFSSLGWDPGIWIFNKHPSSFCRPHLDVMICNSSIPTFPWNPNPSTLERWGFWDQISHSLLPTSILSFLEVMAWLVREGSCSCPGSQPRLSEVSSCWSGREKTEGS